jgi:hypothetical protein
MVLIFFFFAWLTVTSDDMNTFINLHKDNRIQNEEGQKKKNIVRKQRCVDEGITTEEIFFQQ